jgi:hypothetical protein
MAAVRPAGPEPRMRTFEWFEEAFCVMASSLSRCRAMVGFRGAIGAAVDTARLAAARPI